jgi:hypothetical protein
MSSNEDMLLIIIREVYQDPSQVGLLSFPLRGLEEVRPLVSDRILKPETDYEGDANGESGYTIIGGGEVEVLPAESGDTEDDTGNDEE